MQAKQSGKPRLVFITGEEQIMRRKLTGKTRMQGKEKVT
jgi:hypothetical protein